MSFIPGSQGSNFSQAIESICEPVLKPIRDILSNIFPGGGMDFSPFVLIILIHLLKSFLRPLM